MRNAHGTPIWFELMTSDPDAAQGFYQSVIGWTTAAFPLPNGEPGEYRVFSASDGDGIGGLMKTPEGGPPPGWFGYIGVDDVDAAAAAIAAAGGSVCMPPMTVEGVGRMALVTDPQGAPFYVMKGESAEPSNAFKRMAPGHGEWNELHVADDQAALAFYADRFGWRKEGAMPMGAMGDYSFLSHDGGVIGAVMRARADERPHWRYFFRVGDIDQAEARIAEAGGTIERSAHEVPGGDFVVYAADPQGARFGVVGSRG